MRWPWSRPERQVPKGMQTPPPATPANLLSEMGQIQFGLRCMMALGGHKVSPGLTDVEMRKRADVEGNRIANGHVALRVAEQLILEKGLYRVYVSRVAAAHKGLEELVKPKVAQNLGPGAQALRDSLTRRDGNGKQHVQGAGGEGERPVGEEGIRPH